MDTIYHPFRVMIFSETMAPRAVAQHISSINGSRNNGTNGRLGNILKDLGAQEDCIAFGKVVGFRTRGNGSGRPVLKYRACIPRMLS